MKHYNWVNRESEAREAGRLYVGTTASIAANVEAVLAVIGNNCRLHGMSRESAESVLLKIDFEDVPPADSNWTPSDHFWDSFYYGTQTEIIRPELIPNN